jgi:hypothetical protein
VDFVPWICMPLNSILVVVCSACWGDDARVNQQSPPPVSDESKNKKKVRDTKFLRCQDEAKEQNGSVNERSCRTWVIINQYRLVYINESRIGL